MRKFCLILTALFLCTDYVSAASREQSNTAIIRQTSARSESSVSRNASNRIVTSRPTRSASNQRQTSARTSARKIVTGRSAIRKATQPLQATRVSRAATSTNKSFGSTYNSCRDAYFTCMDQFCATQNETYRRCVCSSKLKDIQNQEKTLSQTAANLQDFDDLNISAISKTAAETKAMLSATSGEAAIKKDNSTSANTLKNITNILNSSKKNALSTQGSLDVAGNIKEIWSTTNFIGGTDLANMTGESLFNAVHAQCSELVASYCESTNLKMVSSAYGMYVENDCALLENNIKLKTTAANAAIRSTRHKMQDARLENYNAHNSLDINDCISKVRSDITASTACGEGYIRCLDFSGKYLNITTGEPIYSPEFYQIENQISLSGDSLKNSQNASFITMLNKKRAFAEKDLALCQDNADEVWNEFLRQALVEIYQAQQKRVETVKNECLQVVNECYLKQSDSLKSFSDDSSPITFVQTLELTEEMCADKLNTCSNLYGGGPDGLNVLIATMAGITDATIEQSCPDLLATFAKSVCAVPDSDSMHSYPYGCRKYAPGENRYARTAICNTTLVNPFSRSDILITKTKNNDYSDYMAQCSDYVKRYTSCASGYYLYNDDCNDSTYNPETNYCQTEAVECRLCDGAHICPGGSDAPLSINGDIYQQCGQYYIGSLYQQLVIYALQNCVRITDTTNILPESLLAEIDQVVNSVRKSLIATLADECIDMNGAWVDTAWIDENADGYNDNNNDVLNTDFYITTGANKLWGYCKDTTK